jgi:hypothetical protein
VDGSGVFPGDAQSLLQVIDKTESFPLDVRMRAAEMANTRERPALQAVDSNIKDQRQYVVMMPEPVKNLDEWRRKYGEADQPASDPESDQKVEQIRDQAEAKDELP